MLKSSVYKTEIADLDYYRIGLDYFFMSTGEEELNVPHAYTQTVPPPLLLR